MISSRSSLFKALGVSKSNIGFGLAMGSSVDHTLMLDACGILGSNVSPVQPLLFASPNNYMTSSSGSTTGTTYLQQINRMYFYIGSVDRSNLVTSLNGWYSGASGPVNYANAYTVVKMSLEKNGATSSIPITFSGSRSITINPGDTDIQCDPISPSIFGLTKFTVGDKYWLRIQLSVATVGMKMPNGFIGLTTNQNQLPPASFGWIIDPAVYVGKDVDEYGNITATSGATVFSPPYTPLILGAPVSAGSKSILGAGDSILRGTGDTLVSYGIAGGFTQALFDADHVSNPIAGANFGLAGTNANIWNSETSAKIREYLKYATHVVDEYGSNYFSTSPGSLSTAQSQSSALWGYAIAAGCKVLRPKMLQRNVTDIYTPYNSAWAAGGGARSFNAWLDTQYTSEILAMTRNSLRAGSTEGTDAFYQWGNASYTTDFIHPIAAGHVIDASDYRAAFAAL